MARRKTRAEKIRYLRARSRVDPYEVLGVARDADTAAVKRAYRRMAKETHPDKCRGDATAEARFKAVADAYAVLSDPETREIFDGMRWREDDSSPPPRFRRPDNVFMGYVGGFRHYHCGGPTDCPACGTFSRPLSQVVVAADRREGEGDGLAGAFTGAFHVPARAG